MSSIIFGIKVYKTKFTFLFYEGIPYLGKSSVLVSDFY